MLTRGAQVTGVAVCGLCLTWITVAMRFYVRVCMLRFVGREDWLTVAAMVIFTLLCSLLLILTTYGLGAHLAAIPKEWLPTAARYTFISELLYVACTAVTKLSIGIYFLRLASPNSPYQRYVIHINMAVVSIYSSVYFFFLIFQCHPVQYLWDQFEGSLNHGSCLSTETLANATYAHAAMSALTDWAFGILPVFFVWKMKMNPRTKISVVLILSLGFFASTATIVRIVYIHALTITPDYSWEGINLVKWSIVEPAIGITAANISTLRPLFQRVLNAPRLPFLRKAKKMTTSSSADGDSHDGDSGASFREIEGASVDNGARYRVDRRENWNADFAGLLGLPSTGVTTHISAGNRESRHPLARIRQVWKARKDEEDGVPVWGGSNGWNGSQRELKSENHS